MAGGVERDGDPAASPDPLATLRSLARQRAELGAALRDVNLRLAEAMRRERAQGSSWREIAEATEFKNSKAAQSWAQVTAPPAPEPPGITVTEASRRLGISRPTVYARLRSGTLRSTVDSQGLTRVLLDEDG